MTNDNQDILTAEDHKLFLDIAKEIHKNPTEYREAGKWLDEYCSNDAYWQRQGTKLKELQQKKKDFPVLTNIRSVEQLERKIKERKSPALYIRFKEAQNHLLKKYKNEQFIPEDDAKQIIIITWLLTDPDAEKADLVITEFEKWLWDTNDDINKISRRFAQSLWIQSEAGHKSWMKLVLIAWTKIGAVKQHNTSSFESNRIFGDTWSLAGITINCKNMLLRMRRLSGWRKFVAYSLLLLMVTLTVGYYTRTLWTPFIKRVPSDSPTRTQPDAPIISKEGNFIEISKLELLGIQNCEFPYEDKILYSFMLTGSFQISEVSEKYSLVVFYKVLSYPDQRYGWFLVHKLDKKGFGIPNSISLDELNPSSWNFYTSRLYLPKDETPIIQFIAFALPTKTLIELERVLVNDELGWGKQSLDFLKNRPDIFHSKIIVFQD